ncbi:alkaline phosphatase family protein [Mycolicibacterium vaccae]|uniref:Type I phosphodiesterase/nucleotide pyrophosphatase n=1 Tax=Mycolicibacterium vaccae ATCC 25954 TaxID=1194972 RepID=K0UVL8_MYCVA|nr:alkaline phosphatase family protein [Mycolicibacterium vaccae]ANI40026.1 phosphodiesterase [Mycolicibacterium vaccae 95051]EJZ09065.1 type I phosphodiesterase/nucleotide pyrophosphatase [Mycolicibacterium vaccae ATCC 25954]MCV7063376.1 alkaline phosphatase family protein [Mycolicibacterium vaccae]
MGYANHIGRVGALAVTLGVGWAIASATGVANAETTDSAGSSQATSESTSSPSSETANDASPAKETGAKDDVDAKADEPDDEAVESEDEEAESEEDDSALSAPDSETDQTQDRAADADEDDLEADDPEDETVPAPTSTSTTASTTSASITTASTTEAAVVTVVADEAKSPLAPQPAPEPAAPLQGSAMLASLVTTRDELQRNTVRRTAATTPAAAYIDDGTPNVLVIGVDGLNLSQVLANPEITANFWSLIQASTTAASTIVGHTTISNPSWTSILTGAWGEKTGVINNVFTPWTYQKWPTVFSQLEALSNGAIETTSIANWDVISAIAATGARADNIFNVAPIDGDTNWFLADDEVGDLTEAAIAAASAATANFVFSYFVGIDENGHEYGGDSPEYLAALANFDRNLGEIMQAITLWEGLTGEKWTVMMITDHGHQPQLGLGHGFQSPDETTTFVITRSPGLFGEGLVNLKYSIVDVTPTALALFGYQPTADNLDGVSMTDLRDADVTPIDNDEALRGTLQDIIAKYGYPDIGTSLALGARTIFASVPYYVDMLTTGISASLQSIADAGIFLISPLAALAIIPVRFFGGLAYVGTNVVAQIVARLTGVTGASIFPLWPPAPPSFPQSPQEASTPELVALVCSDGRVSSAVFACGETTVAA